MRKKYLSALLFGALLVTSAGTFTSCKDYDDDINNLQEQITANADAIKSLEELVKNGKYVTAVAMEGQTITFTFSDDSTTPITIPEGEKGQVVEVKNNELYIDNEPTGIKVSEDATAETGSVKAENGTWWVLGENGEYTNTNIPVSGVTVSGSEADGYTFTIYENGKEPQTVKLPSATSSLVDIILVDSKNSTADENASSSALQYQTVSFTKFEEFNYTQNFAWPGKALPSNGQVIVAQDKALLVQLNPTNVDGKDVKFSLVDSKKASAGLDLVASDYTDLLTVTSRTANENGLYNLAVEDMIFDNATAAGSFFDNFVKDGVATNNKRYAVKAGNVLSEYNVLCSNTPTSVSINYEYNIKDAANNKVNGATPLNLTNTGVNTANAIKLVQGQWYTVSADMTDIYDLFLSADKNQETLYGLEFKNEDGVYQFRYTKTPDNISKPEIVITIQSVDKQGTYNSTKVTFTLSEVISSAYTYPETAWTLVDYDQTVENNHLNKNAFSVKMDDMLNSFSDENLALWNTKVKAFTVQLFDVETGKIAKDKDGNNINGLADGMCVLFYDKDGEAIESSNAYNGNAYDEGALAQLSNHDDILKAKTIKLGFVNRASLAEDLKLDHKYKVVITFVGTAEGTTNTELSTTEIPFTLSIPTIDKLFVEQAGVFVNGVANAYMDEAATSFGPTATAIDAEYSLSKAFVDFANKIGNSTFDLEVDNVTKIDGTHKSSELAQLNGSNQKIENVTKATIPTIQLTDGVDGANNQDGTQKGYKQELILKVTNAKFAGVWSYASSTTTVNYSFKIKLMSPIFEGKVYATDLENGIVVPSTAIDGFKVNDSHVKGETYNKEVYSIFSDKLSSSTSPSPWKRKEIAAVNFKSANENIFTVTPTGTNYKEVGDDKTPVFGCATITPVPLGETASSDLEITITDAWGYKLTQKVKVTVEVR